MLGRGANPASGEAQVTSDTVPDIGRALLHARTKAGLSLPEAAIRVGVASSELEALESGTVARMPDRIQTLRRPAAPTPTRSACPATPMS